MKGTQLRGRILQPVNAKGDAPHDCRGPRLIQIGQREVTRKLGSKVLFWLPTVFFRVFPPYRDSRQCSAPKPGKEKHNSYDYGSAILIIHRFQSFLSVFTP